MFRAALLVVLLAAGLALPSRAEVTPVRAEDAAMPHAYSRKLKQAPSAVCCLISQPNAGQGVDCTQQAPSTTGGTAKQQGLVNVQGVYVQAGCIQVVADVGACVQVGSLIGTGHCLPGGQSTTVGAPQLPVTLPTPVGTPPGPIVTLPGTQAQPGQISSSRSGLLGGLLGGVGR